MSSDYVADGDCANCRTLDAIHDDGCPDAYSGHLPRRQYFDFTRWTWDINAADELAEGRRSDRTVTVAELLPMFAMGIISVDKDYAHMVDLAKPLYLAPFPPDGSALVIDGWHRLWRAHTEGVDELPAITFTEAESATFRTENTPRMGRPLRRPDQAPL